MNLGTPGKPVEITKALDAVREVMNAQKIPPGPHYMTISHETAMEQFGFTRKGIAYHKRQNKKLHKGTRGVLVFEVHVK